MLHETPFNYMASWEIPSLYWKITYALIQPIWKTTWVLAELAFAAIWQKEVARVFSSWEMVT